MIASLVRNLLAALVVLGIVLPQATAALAARGLADGRMMVICTGDGLRTVRFDGDGTPVEVSETAELCALVHAADTAVLPSVAAPLSLPRVAPPDLPLHVQAPGGRLFSPSLPRAPPHG